LGDGGSARIQHHGGLGPAAAKLFVGKREIREIVPAGQTRRLDVPVKFSRIPKEIEVRVLNVSPREKP